MPGQVEDRVADELSGPVVGRLAAAIRLDDLDVGAVRDVELAFLGPASQGDDRRVLEEEDRVGDRSPRDGRGEGALEVPRLEVGHRAEVHEVGAAGHAVRLARGLHSLARAAPW